MNINSSFTAWLIAAACAGATFPVAAQQADAEPELQTIVITASRAEQKLEEVPASVTVVGDAQIGATPAQTLDDVLRSQLQMNAISSIKQHPTSNGLSMRGVGSFGDTRALVLLDGIPLNNPFSGYVQWYRVPMETIERVEIVRGGGSSLWGNYAMGGVVNIISHLPTQSELQADLGYGAFDTRRANAYGALADSEAFRVSVDGNYFETAGFIQVPETFVDPSGYPGARNQYDLPVSSKTTNLQVTGNFKVDASLTGYARLNAHENSQILGTRYQTNSDRGTDLAAGMTKVSASGDALSATIFYTDATFRTNNSDTTRWANENVTNAHVQPVTSLGGSIQWNRKLSNLWPLLSLGADYNVVHGRNDAAIFQDKAIDPAGEFLRVDVGSGRQELAGVFAQASIQPSERLLVSGSARGEQIRTLDGYTSLGGIETTYDDKTHHAFSPRVSARYVLTDSWALRAAAYGAFRAPNLDNLYRSYAAYGAYGYSNPYLKPERLEGAELGFDFDRAHARTQLTAFQNTIRDFIAYYGCTGPAGDGTCLTNAERMRSRGLEVNTDWRIDARWQAILAYAYTSAEIVKGAPGAEYLEGKQLAELPRNSASVELLYSKGGIQAGARIRYVQRMVGAYGNASYPVNDLFIDQHTIVDASISYAATDSLRLYAKVENLLNKSYIVNNDSYSPPQLGTPFSLFCGVRWSIKRAAHE